MSRKIDRGKPTPPPWWVELHAAMDSPTVPAEKMGKGAWTARCYGQKYPVLKKPKHNRHAPSGWAEVNVLSYRRSMREAVSIMAQELAPLTTKGFGYGQSADGQ